VPALAGRRILVAAASAVVRRVVREDAEGLGCRVVEAVDPSKAPAALRAAAARGEPCVAAFLFAAPEDERAAAVAAELRRDPDLARTALVLVAEGPHPGGARAAEDAGFDAYLVHPVRHEDLRDTALSLVARGGTRGPFVTRRTLAVARREASGGAAPGTEEASLRTRRRVLLAEDNAVNQKVAARMLERLNCVVDVAANGKEAVAMVDRFPYDLVLMDCQMPEMDGYDAAREIRRREAAGRRVPIVALTAHALDEDRQRCLDAGMDEYVRKPVSPEELSRTLLRWAPAPDVSRPA
jgi:CheY-like chemotaxis protein